MTGTEPHAWGTGLMDDIIFVGLDVHKATVCIAVAEGGRGGEVRQLGVFENRSEILSKVVSRLSKGGRRLSFCYEAGPCGYGLHRLLTGYGHECVVIAPSLIPMKAGDRVKTDRRVCADAGEATSGRRADGNLDTRCRTRGDARFGAIRRNSACVAGASVRELLLITMPS